MLWPEIVDRVAGGGAVLAVKFAPAPAPVLAVVQGRDEMFVQKFAKLAFDILDQELARQEAKQRLQRRKYRAVEVMHVGDDFHAAVLGSAILVSNKAKALELSIDLHLNGAQKSAAGVRTVAEARKLLPADPLACAWINLETVKKLPQAKEVFSLPRNDVNVTVLFGSWLDVIGRSPFACAGLYRTSDGFLTTLRVPAGRDGRTADLAPHVPAKTDQIGSLPLLEPKSAVASTSYYFDLSQYWEQRTKLFNAKQVKTFEEFDKTAGRLMGGVKFSKLVAQAGPHQRIVVTGQNKPNYRITPTLRLPAFALVVDMRDKAFAKSMETVLRGGALLAGTQFKLKLIEEKHGDVTLVGYRFPEDGGFPNDPSNIRFNFSPCFAAVGGQYLIASTFELGHELADLLQKEAKSPAKKEMNAVTERSRICAAGGATFLHIVEDQLIAQTILGQALAPEEARQQAQALIDLVRRLGVLETETEYAAKTFRYDLRLKLGK